MTAFVNCLDSLNNPIGVSGNVWHTNIDNTVSITGSVNAADSGSGYSTVVSGKSSDTVLKSGAGVFKGVIVTGGIGIGTPTFHDSTDSSGAVVGVVSASAPLGLSNVVPPGGIKFSNGLTLSGSITNPAMTIVFD